MGRPRGPRSRPPAHAAVRERLEPPPSGTARGGRLQGRVEPHGGLERRGAEGGAGSFQGSAADATREAAIADARARGVVSDFRPSGVYYEEDEEQLKNTEKEGKSHGGADGHAMRGAAAAAVSGSSTRQEAYVINARRCGSSQ